MAKEKERAKAMKKGKAKVEGLLIRNKEIISEKYRTQTTQMVPHPRSTTKSLELPLFASFAPKEAIMSRIVGPNSRKRNQGDQNHPKGERETINPREVKHLGAPRLQM